MRVLLGNYGANLFVSKSAEEMKARGLTRLQIAVLLGELGVARNLLETVSPLEAQRRYPDGKTLLHHVVRGGGDMAVGLIDMLFRWGLKVDAADDNTGATAVHHAVMYPRYNYKALERLLKNLTAAGTDLRDRGGRTPTHWAAAFDNTDAIYRLGGAGADVTVQDERGLTPLHVAAILNKVGAARYLCHANQTLAHIADAKGQLPVVTALLHSAHGVARIHTIQLGGKPASYSPVGTLAACAARVCVRSGIEIPPDRRNLTWSWIRGFFQKDLE